MMSIPVIVSTLKEKASTQRELAVAIHDFVRDNIKFGFTKKFDQAPAEYTLEREIGHCTPKSELFCALLRQAGFGDAKVVGVPIPGDVLLHLGSFPSRLHHTFTEVTVEGRMCRVDSYVVDSGLFDRAQRRLMETGAHAGYGVHREGTSEWNGAEDAFSQYVKSTHTPELERRASSTLDLVKQPDYLHAGLLTGLSKPIIGFGLGLFLESSNGSIGNLRRTG